MPRLFTALEIPEEIADRLSILRGGLPGARWIDRDNYHVTLRFFGDVDGAIARDLVALLAESRSRPPIELSLDALDSFGGDRPRSLIARISPAPALARLQAEQEKIARSAGLSPEGRKFTPHVTLARLRDVRATDVAAFIAGVGRFPTLRFTADRFVLMSARDSVGGGPYMIEAAYPFDAGGPAQDAMAAASR